MLVETTLPKPFVFVLMPFDKAFDDIYKFGIKGAANDIGAYAERIDEQLFAEGILDRIFNQISKADVIVADMSGRNPNVFYEVGYSHALGKNVTLLTRAAEDIPFDLKHRYHIIYDDIDSLRRELAPRLQWAIGEEKQRRSPVPANIISLTIQGIPLICGVDSIDPPEITLDTHKRKFRLSLLLRNDGPDPIYGISHSYLFAAPDSPAVPCTTVINTGDRSERVAPMRFVRANEIDAPDGLDHQYRLQPRISSSIPPGAMEESHFEMLLLDGHESGDAIYRIRLHTTKRYFDYTFRLHVRLVDAATT